MTDGRILVAGANGRLGSTVLGRLGANSVAGVRRPRPGTNDIHIDSDGHIDPKQLDGIQAIINCAGVINGSRDLLEQGNVTYPMNLATMAKRLGIKNFVQVSSFSVFGRAERIERRTPISPDGDYGQSKLRAEQQLQGLAASDFRVAALRMPFIFSAEHPGLLGSLISVMSRARILPTVTGRPSRRSVITYDLAAALLIELARADSPSSPLCAADPQVLDLVALVATLRARLGRRIAVLPVPPIVARAMAVTAPRLSNRLLGSCVLDPSTNIAAARADGSTDREIARYLDGLKQQGLEANRSSRS